MGTKRSVLTVENGLPLSVVLSGANTPDVKLLEATLDHIRDFPSGTGGRPPTKSVFGRRLTVGIGRICPAKNVPPHGRNVGHLHIPYSPGLSWGASGFTSGHTRAAIFSIQPASL